MSRKKNKNNSVEESSFSLTPTEIKDNESISFEETTSDEKNIIINKYHYFGNINKSVFEIKNYNFTRENFLSWYNHLIVILMNIDN